MANDDYEGFLKRKVKAKERRDRKIKDKDKSVTKKNKSKAKTVEDKDILSKYPNKIYDIENND